MATATSRPSSAASASLALRHGPTTSAPASVSPDSSSASMKKSSSTTSTCAPSSAGAPSTLPSVPSGSMLGVLRERQFHGAHEAVGAKLATDGRVGNPMFDQGTSEARPAGPLHRRAAVLFPHN